MRHLMAALAIATCPCHLPLLLVLLGGTAVGAGLSEHMAAVFAALTVLFVLSAGAALRMFSQPDPADGETRPARTSKTSGVTHEPDGRAR